MEQTKDYTPENVRSCFVVIATAVFVAAMVILAACAKQDQGQPDITGAWTRAAPAIEYRFFDDSRFQQSDLPGEQWIWKQGAGRVDLLGNPKRLWFIAFDGPNEVRVIETDTFTIYRQ